MKILILTADPKTLLCHRKELIRSLAMRGWEVVGAACGEGGPAADFLESLGGHYIALGGARAGLNPLQDYRSYKMLRALMRAERPDALLPYTIKAVCYGSLAAAKEGVPAIYPLICGLGYAFADQPTMKQRVIGEISGRLYRMALRKASTVFLQNHDDEKQLRDLGILHPATRSQVVNGSGVELDAFPFCPPNEAAVRAGKMKFVLVSRLLKSKGIPEYVAAASILKARHPQWEFHLLGAPDPSPDGISAAQAQAWVDAGVIQYHGNVSDVRPHLRGAQAFVLPTYYREGVPRATLEALATGLPIVTTDAVGSRETVSLNTNGTLQKRAGESVMEGRNGYLVRPRDITALVGALEALASNPERHAAMAHASRALAQTRFDVHRVNAVMLSKISTPVTRSSKPFTPASL
jgi:glycosyltransferase involved in cell wall biosynthesis